MSEAGGRCYDLEHREEHGNVTVAQFTTGVTSFISVQLYIHTFIRILYGVDRSLWFDFTDIH